MLAHEHRAEQAKAIIRIEQRQELIGCITVPIDFEPRQRLEPFAFAGLERFDRLEKRDDVAALHGKTRGIGRKSVFEGFCPVYHSLACQSLCNCRPTVKRIT